MTDHGTERPMPASDALPESTRSDPPPPVPETETPRPERGPRLWPRVLGVAILLLGAGGVFVWQKPETVLGPLRGIAGPAPVGGDRLQGLEGRLARLEQRGDPAERLNALEKRPLPDLDPLIARLDKIEAALPAQGMSGQGGAVQTASSGASDIDLTPLLARLDLLEKRAAAPAGQTRVDAISTRVEALPARDPTADLRARLEANEKQIAALTAASGKTADLSDRTARASRLHAAATELANGRALGDIPGAPPALTRFATAAPPTIAGLRLAFPSAEQAALKVSLPDTSTGSFTDRIAARLRDFHLITVRQGDRVLIGNSVSADLTRARAMLEAGDLSGAVKIVAAVPGPPAKALAPWLDGARALLAAREALATLAGNG